MAKLRCGGFVFLTWQGDHAPRHVHVYAAGRLIVKWNLDDMQPMRGRAPARLIHLIERLRGEGKL